MRKTFKEATFKLADVWRWLSSQEETKELTEYKEKEQERRREMVLNYRSRRAQARVKRRIEFYPSVKVQEFKKDETGLVNASLFVELKE